MKILKILFNFYYANHTNNARIMRMINMHVLTFMFSQSAVYSSLSIRPQDTKAQRKTICGTIQSKSKLDHRQHGCISPNELIALTFVFFMHKIHPNKSKPCIISFFFSVAIHSCVFFPVVPHDCQETSDVIRSRHASHAHGYGRRGV